MAARFIRNWAATNMGTEFPQWIGRRNFREIAANEPSVAPDAGTEASNAS